jgi:anaerobic selenocysteine-containing dehydrogenase
LVHVDGNGRVTNVSGDPESQTSRGYICAKGMAAPEFIYHPDRVTHPLRRTGPRGSGQWVRIDWEEALLEISNNLQRVRAESGPEYIALCQGTGRPYTEFTGRFIHALGSPNFVSPGHNCFVPRTIASGITVGWMPMPDIYARGGLFPACILQIGQNSPEFGAADGICGSMILRAMQKAQELIVIDPRRTQTARRADLHLPLRPGTDGALILSMLHVIIGEKLYDRAFVAQHCSGFEELRGHIAAFSPEWAEPITQVPAGQIRRAARNFAMTRPACVLWGNGMDMSTNAFQAARAVLILIAVTGNLDVPGGMVRWVPPAGVRSKSPLVDRAIQGEQFLSSKQKSRMIGAGRFPFAPGCHQPTFWRACVTGKPYRPRAVWFVGTNPILTATRGDVIEDALANHIEFSVVSDFFLTPTAELADIVLPAAHWLEQDDVVYFHKLWCVLARRKLAQVGEVRDDRDVILDLAARLGLQQAFPWPNRRAYLEWLLGPSGLSFDEFAEQSILLGDMRYRKHEQEGFPTPSGKVELLSPIMEHAGRPSLPVFMECTGTSKKDYPLTLISGCKVLPFFHSEGRQIPSLRRLHPEPRVEVHPETASSLSLEAGQRVLVVTPFGSAEFTLHLDDSLALSVVHAEHAWWFPEKPGPDHEWRRSCVNLLFGHDAFDPESGAEPLKSSLCRLERGRTKINPSCSSD